MTTFYPYQWDLNYWNPVVLNEMVGNMLNLVNGGLTIRIDAVPYIWKQLGTNRRNLKMQVHSIVRIMRIICEIVCRGSFYLERW